MSCLPSRQFTEMPGLILSEKKKKKNRIIKFCLQHCRCVCISVLKAPCSSKIDIFFFQERFNKLCDHKMWHLTACKISFSLSFLNWNKNEMIIWSYLWIMLAILIQRYDNKSFNFKNERLIEIFTGCQVTHFMIVLIPHINLLNLSWVIKCLFLRDMEPFSFNTGRWGVGGGGGQGGEGGWGEEGGRVVK